MSPFKKREEDDEIVESKVTLKAEEILAEGPITFSAYCVRKGIPERQRAGMKSYTTTKRATFAEWEKIFVAY